MRIFTIILASFLAITAVGQTVLTSTKGYTKRGEKNNPINPFTFCADPTAVEYEGRMYVYGTNDQQQFNEGDGFMTEGNNYGKINTLVCMSSADLVNWTIHQNVDVKGAAKWTNNSWAPSITSRVEEDGKTHFYLYFANGASGIGVLTATKPIGPWKDPLGKALIPWGKAGMGDIVWLFDPGVVVDEDGTGWITWGGGGEPHANNIAKGANAMLDMNTRLAKLNPDMISIDAENIIVLPAPYHFEASELNIIGGKFVYTYCSNWSGDRSMWGQFTQYDKSKAKPAAPGVAQMCYMTSTDPLNPDSWMYAGMYGKNPSDFKYPGGNNHTHLQKFNGSYYYIYHCHATENGLMKEYGGTKGGYRNIQIDKIVVDEKNSKIGNASMSVDGASQITENRPVITDVQPAEMVWNYSGVDFVPFTGNRLPEVAVSISKAGSWTANRLVYTADEVKSFRAKIRGKGKMEVRIDDIKSAAIGTVEFNSTNWTNYTISLDQPISSGSHNLFFVFTEVSSTAKNEFKEWQFMKDDVTAISSPQESARVIKEEYYTLSGAKCEKPQTGICVIKRTLANGQRVSEKVMLP